ncbi:MAG: hypothetical protein HYZ75_09790 [Elusimicrobia bacterium]|nr:hypothetical protein [Elusimicrobiota bacterium]
MRYLAVVLLLAGCMGPGSRIKKNPAVFNALPAEAREKIKAAKIDLGFTTEMVRLAFGEPGRRFRKVSAGGEEEVWVYRNLEPGGGTYIRPHRYGGVSQVVHYYDAVRVTFKDGKVAGFEEVER